MNIRIGDIIRDEGNAAVDPYRILHYSETAPLIESWNGLLMVYLAWQFGGYTLRIVGPSSLNQRCLYDTASPIVKSYGFRNHRVEALLSMLHLVNLFFSLPELWALLG